MATKSDFAGLIKYFSTLKQSMKKTLFITYFFLSIFNSFSQDKIYLYSGDYIDAKVTEVGSAEIKYKKYNYQDGPTIVVSISEIVMIIYENGDKDVFAEVKKANENNSINENTIGKSSAEMMRVGEEDARIKYTSYKPFWGTFVPTIIFSPAGIVTGLIIGLCKPTAGAIKQTNPDSNLIKNPDYLSGYKHKMKQKKWGRVWGGFGIGIAVNVFTYYLLVRN